MLNTGLPQDIYLNGIDWKLDAVPAQIEVLKKLDLSTCSVLELKMLNKVMNDFVEYVDDLKLRQSSIRGV
jgi:hypothetical protein